MDRAELEAQIAEKKNELEQLEATLSKLPPPLSQQCWTWNHPKEDGDFVIYRHVEGQRQSSVIATVKDSCDVRAVVSVPKMVEILEVLPEDCLRAKELLEFIRGSCLE